jgi:hypothetical protein
MWIAQTIGIKALVSLSLAAGEAHITSSLTLLYASRRMRFNVSARENRPAFKFGTLHSFSSPDFNFLLSILCFSVCRPASRPP